MNRTLFLTLASIVAFSIGCIALFLPTTLLVDMKSAVPNPAALVMARTAGILLVVFGLLNFSIRKHPPSNTLRGVLLANLLLQLGIMPIDPLAYFSGAYASPASFIPNTILHLLLAFGFFHYYRKMPHTEPSPVYAA